MNADPTEIGDVHDRLWDRSADLADLRIARPLGSDPALRVLWTLGVPGASLGARVEPGATAAIARVAATVAALHDSGVPVPHVVRSEDCLAEGRKKASKLGEALPRCRSAVAAIAPHDSRFGSAGGGRRRSCTVTSISTSSSTVRTARCSSTSTRWPPATPSSTWPSWWWTSCCDPCPSAGRAGVRASNCSRPTSVTLPRRPIRLGLLRALADAEFLTRCHRSLRRRAPGWEVELERALEHHARPGRVTVLPILR